MYEQAYMSIGKGLRLVFFGEILTTVAGLFSWFGLSLIGLVLTIVGLGMAGQGDSAGLRFLLDRAEPFSIWRWSFWG